MWRWNNKSSKLWDTDRNDIKKIGNRDMREMQAIKSEREGH